jgi:hypothetical protein
MVVDVKFACSPIVTTIEAAMNTLATTLFDSILYLSQFVKFVLVHFQPPFHIFHIFHLEGV